MSLWFLLKGKLYKHSHQRRQNTKSWQGLSRKSSIKNPWFLNKRNMKCLLAGSKLYHRDVFHQRHTQCRTVRNLLLRRSHRDTWEASVLNNFKYSLSKVEKLYRADLGEGVIRWLKQSISFLPFSFPALGCLTPAASSLFTSSGAYHLWGESLIHWTRRKLFNFFSELTSSIN